MTNIETELIHEELGPATAALSASIRNCAQKIERQGML